jgi:hypothetical protein
MSDELLSKRRRVLSLAATGMAATLAGCGGAGTPTPTPESVPQEYRTATSIGGTERNPDGLSSQSAVDYQDSPSDGRQCAGCQYYIEDKNGDGMGACAIVEGQVAPEAYCVSYVSYQTATEN